MKLIYRIVTGAVLLLAAGAFFHAGMAYQRYDCARDLIAAVEVEFGSQAVPADWDAARAFCSGQLPEN